MMYELKAQNRCSIHATVLALKAENQHQIRQMVLEMKIQNRRWIRETHSLAPTAFAGSALVFVATSGSVT
jgi:hypothetical protein